MPVSCGNSGETADAKIADGEYAWEDYVEHDGITDPKLHKIALKMTKHDGKMTLDFNGTDRNRPADQLASRLCGRRVPDQWIAPILRNLADTPERAAEIHVNEGVCDVFEVIFPPKGTLISRNGRRRPTRAPLCCCAARLLAGVVAQRWTGGCLRIRKPSLHGIFGTDLDGKSFLSRRCLVGLAAAIMRRQ